MHGMVVATTDDHMANVVATFSFKTTISPPKCVKWTFWPNFEMIGFTPVIANPCQIESDCVFTELGRHS